MSSGIPIAGELFKNMDREKELAVLVLERAINQLELCDKINLHGNFKLISFRIMVTAMFKHIFEEMCAKGTYELLKQDIEELVKEQEDEKQRIEELNRLALEARQIEGQVETTEREMQQELQLLNVKISSMKDVLDVRIEELTRKLQFCREYEMEKIKQFNERQRIEFESWVKKIQDLEQQIENETQRNQQVESEMCSEIEELQMKFKNLENQGKENRLKMDSRVNELLQHKKDLTLTLSNLESVLQERKQVIEDDRLAKEDEMQNMRIFSAVIKIQSWWRGLITRRLLARGSKKKRFLKNKPEDNKNISSTRQIPIKLRAKQK